MAKPRKKGGRKASKNIPVGIAHIYATFNNTIVTLTDVEGNVLAWSAAGVKGFKEIPHFVSDKVVMKEVTIRGAIGVTSTGYEKAIRLLESGKYPVEKMHTHDFDLREAELAVRTLAREIPDDESIHSCLVPEH